MKIKKIISKVKMYACLTFKGKQFREIHVQAWHSPSYDLYIFQLIRFARVCSNVDDFINRNLFLTAKLLKQV